MAETARYGAQTRTRRAVLDVLYAARLWGRGAVETFIEARDLTAVTARELTTRAAHGVTKHQEEVDACILTAFDGPWTLERTPAVGCNLARTAIFEVDHTDTFGPVVTAEAVRLAQEPSTNGSPGFLNSLLSKALSIKGTNS